VILRWLVLTGSQEPEDPDIDDGEVTNAVALRHHGRVMTNPPMFDPDDLVDVETDEMAQEGVPETTRAIYRREWKHFVDWCGNPTNGAGHPRAHMPATVATVRKYIKDHWAMTRTKADGSTVLAGRYGRPYAPTTVALRLAVISVVHQWQGLPSPTRHKAVHVQFRGYRRRWSKAKYRPDVAYPLTPDDMIAMVRTCDLTTVQGIRNAAMIRLHYELGCRASELCNLTFADLHWETIDRLIVHIELAKGDKERDCGIETDTTFVPELDTLLLLRQWIELAAMYGITEGALFVEVNPGRKRKDGQISGSLRRTEIDRHAYEMVFIRAAERAGVDRDATGKKRHISTHSARSGFITAAVDAGLEIAQIAPHTGHALESPVIHRYYRQGRKWGQYNPGRRIREARRRRLEEQENAA
jgi:integrase